METAGFVHLHNHTEYSLLDGALRIDRLVQAAQSFKMSALAITDHGNLFGAIHFYRAAQEAGVKPILGMEAYLAPGDRRERRVYPQIPESNFHLTLLAQDEEGYHNLIRLASLAALEGFYYRPRIDKEILAQYAKGLIGLSGCLKGEVPYRLLKDDLDAARQAADDYRSILGPENFFLEVQDLGLSETRGLIPLLLKLSKELGIPVVATNDCHYLRREDHRAHDVLLCIQTGKKLAEPGRLRFETREAYFKSPEEMMELFSELPEAIKNTISVAERCNLLLDLSGRHFQLPEYSKPDGFKTHHTYLAHLVQEGLSHRYRLVTPEISERAEHELSIIQGMGFSGYFLIAKEIVDYARSQGIPVGPGRGSAAGSLVLYALGITDIDPIRYGLIFERFLNPKRLTIPDIDIDFADTRRDEVIEYIRRRYGAENVAQIITFGTMQARAVVRDVGRVLEIPYLEVDRIAKLIPFGASLAEATRQSELKELINSKPEYQELAAIARELEGMVRHASIHASGVVIAPRPLVEFVPLYRLSSGEVCTGYDMASLGACGLPKFDILGLRTLSVIDSAFRLIASEGTELDRSRIGLDDEKTYKLLRDGETVGTFQLESAGMRDILRRFKPDSIEELIAVISLYRPGPLGSVNIADFIERKCGRKSITYLHPRLEPVLKETYGVSLYQEQVMQIAGIIGGFDMAQADRLRRAMAKKDPDLMEELREEFIKGAHRHHIPNRVAEAIFDAITPFAGYGFNKSHSAGYAHLSYLTAYLKTNYPKEFMCALLTSELGNSEKLYHFLGEARRMSIPILPPDVNSSNYNFTLEGEGIRFGLGGIKNVGAGAAQAIMTARRTGVFTTLFDFLKRTRPAVNRKCAESLIKAGALDGIDPDRISLLSELPSTLERASSARQEFLSRQASFFEAPSSNSQPRSALTQHELSNIPFEKEAFGFYFSSHPLEPYRELYHALGLQGSSQLDNLGDDQPVTIGGVIVGQRAKRDRNNREYRILSLEDFVGSVEVFVFANLYQTQGQMLTNETPVVVKGRTRSREGEPVRLVADRVIPFAQIQGYIQSITLSVDPTMIDDLQLKQMKGQLEAHPGRCQTFIQLSGSEGGRSRLMRLKGLSVSPAPELLKELKGILGDGAVRLNGRI